MLEYQLEGNGKSAINRSRLSYHFTSPLRSKNGKSQVTPFHRKNHQINNFLHLLKNTINYLPSDPCPSRTPGELSGRTPRWPMAEGWRSVGKAQPGQPLSSKFTGWEEERSLVRANSRKVGEELKSRLRDFCRINIRELKITLCLFTIHLRWVAAKGKWSSGVAVLVVNRLQVVYRPPVHLDPRVYLLISELTPS